MNSLPQKIRKSFKVYKPAVNPILYDCKAMEEVLLVAFAQQTVERDGDRFLKELYLSNLVFLNDLLSIPKKVDHTKPKKEKREEIVEHLSEINKQLPSFVYIPSDSRLSSADHTIRRLILARIETTETKLFPTKSKTNFSCCFELISPEEYLMRSHYPYDSKRDKVIQQQLQKVADLDLKQTHTPKSLLVQSNLGNSLTPVGLTKKKLFGGRISANPRTSLKTEQNKSSLRVTRALRQRAGREERDRRGVSLK